MPLLQLQRRVIMKRYIHIVLMLFFCNLEGIDHNLVVIVDNRQQETVKTDEINMTHQSITALQQRASAVLTSTSLWKNIVDRKKKFAKKLEDENSLESDILRLYQTTNNELQTARYNLAFINQNLSQYWFSMQFPLLAGLSSEDFNQLRFDFACYIFQFNIDQWNVYNAHAGMLLFVPKELNYRIDERFEIVDESDLLKHADKKSNVIESLEKLFLEKSKWVVYLTGHGHPKSSQQGANIAGLKIDEFKKLLHFFNDAMDLKLLVYSSCYGGGVHTIEPYVDMQLNYPVIVTAATDAPIFGFGLFEGVKLPPYDQNFTLQSADFLKNYGLLPSALQNYTAFFKRAWKGQFDLNLVQLISKFFSCDLIMCHVQKIENFPLIRKAGSLIFVPIKDNIIMKLIQQVTGYASITTSKPLLLYTKKVKKIKTDRAVPIISMLPGMQSHEITQMIAPQVLLSQLIKDSFLSLEDMQAYKNFIIKSVTCYNDLIGSDQKVMTLKNLLILGQDRLQPKFLDKKADAIIYFQYADQHYLLKFNDQKITDQMLLDHEQIDAMVQILQYVAQSVDYDCHSAPEKLLTFQSYLENKEYQQSIVDGCVKNKVCRK